MRRRLLTLLCLTVLLFSFLLEAQRSPLIAIVQLMVLGAVLAIDPFRATKRFAALYTELAPRGPVVAWNLVV